ncbi:MAG: energy transducer TonB [Candidatus Acidiferrales bacterium]
MRASILSRTLLIFASFVMAASICGGFVRAQTPPKYEPPTVISTAEALYPINSVASGTVVLEVHLDENGAIDSVEVLHSIPSLTAPAITAVKKWKFGAAKLDGHGIASVIPVAFTFVPPNVGPRI